MTIPTPPGGRSGSTRARSGGAGTTPRRSPAPWKLPLAQQDAAISAVARLITGAVRSTTGTLIDIAGVLHRGIYDKHLRSKSPPDALYFVGSNAGRRYTPPGGPAGFYLSFDPATPLAELRAVTYDQSGMPQPSGKNPPVVVLSYDVSARRILDVTNDDVRRALGLSLAQLRSDWESLQAHFLSGAGAMPPTQLLALAAHELKIVQGIKYRSVRDRKRGVNVVIFPDRLDRTGGDHISVYDDTGYYAGTMP
jgi:hypothetical protein